jgi:quercetin dioxygenase-like cupin family protein
MDVRTTHQIGEAIVELDLRIDANADELTRLTDQQLRIRYTGGFPVELHNRYNAVHELLRELHRRREAENEQYRRTARLELDRAYEESPLGVFDSKYAALSEPEILLSATVNLKAFAHLNSAFRRTVDSLSNSSVHVFVMSIGRDESSRDKTSPTTEIITVVAGRGRISFEDQNAEIWLLPGLTTIVASGRRRSWIVDSYSSTDRLKLIVQHTPPAYTDYSTRFVERGNQ